MLALLFWLIVLGLLSWWLMPLWREWWETLSSGSPRDVAPARPEDDILYRLLERIPKVFTQPHILPLELEGDERYRSGSRGAEKGPSRNGSSDTAARSDRIASDEKVPARASLAHDSRTTRPASAGDGPDDSSGTPGADPAESGGEAENAGRVASATPPAASAGEAERAREPDSTDREEARHREPVSDDADRTRESGDDAGVQVARHHEHGSDTADRVRVAEAPEGRAEPARGDTSADGEPSREPVQPLFEAPHERDDLKRISGVGPVMERRLNELGVVSFAQLAAFEQADIERVENVLEDFPGRIERDDWVGQAKVLAEGKGTTSAPRTGDAPSSRAPAGRDDLTRISGIGKATRSRLNDLGVHSFEQVAALDRADIERIEQALDDEPGRIERDGWIAQARALLAAG